LWARSGLWEYGFCGRDRVYGNMDFVGAIGDVRCGHCLPYQNFYRLVVNRMIRYHRKLVFIFSLFLIAQLNVGCSPKYEVRLLNLKEHNEELFCEAHPNLGRSDSIRGWLFYVQGNRTRIGERKSVI
jgi:hypothetical protein